MTKTKDLKKDFEILYNSGQCDRMDGGILNVAFLIVRFPQKQYTRRRVVEERVGDRFIGKPA